MSIGGPSSSAIGGVTHSTTTVTVPTYIIESTVNESSPSLIVYSKVAAVNSSLPVHPSFFVAVPVSGVPT